MIIRAENEKKEIAAVRIVQDIIGNMTLIKELAKNDMKKKFAGSYFGILWAFVSPIVTICVYWFIFTVGMRGAAADVNGYPFVLWLIAGMVPWFLFSDILTSGTESMTDYDYLVKKMMFNVSILPVMKIVTATVIHLILLFFVLIIFSLMGHLPDIYMLQIPYYMASLWVLSAACIFVSSAVVVFFKDLKQVVSIFLQIFMWMTPIMWQDTLMLSEHPTLAWFIRLNPMYYIVRGYRDALINHVWFWEDMGMTVYFWVVTILLFFFGSSIFQRLRPHFADVI